VRRLSKGHLAHKLANRDWTWSEIEKALDRSTGLRANSKRLYRIRLDIFERSRFTKCGGQVATLRMVQDYFGHIIHGSRITDLFFKGVLPTTIQKKMGHKNLETTVGYNETVEEQLKDVARAL
jgi:hypothetical protein